MGVIFSRGGFIRREAITTRIFSVLGNNLYGIVRNLFHRGDLVQDGSRVVGEGRANRCVVISGFVELIFVRMFTLLLMRIRANHHSLLFLRTFSRIINISRLTPTYVSSRCTFLRLISKIFISRVFYLINRQAVRKSSIQLTVRFIWQGVEGAFFSNGLRIQMGIVDRGTRSRPFRRTSRSPNSLSHTSGASHLTIRVRPRRTIRQRVAISHAPMNAICLAIRQRRRNGQVFNCNMEQVNQCTGSQRLSFNHFRVRVVGANAAGNRRFSAVIRRHVSRYNVNNIISGSASRIHVLHRSCVIQVRVSFMMAGIMVMLFVCFIR